MKSQATAQVTGKAGNNAEVRYAPSGLKIVTAKLAVSHKNHRNDQWMSDWFSITQFGKDAKDQVPLESVLKGDTVSVTGRLRAEEYMAKDGGRRVKVNIIADTVTIHAKLNHNAPANYQNHNETGFEDAENSLL